MGYQNRDKGDGESLGLSVDDLKGKQSVRATFKLPQQVIDLLSVIAGQLGIKQKSLFDQLIEDASVLGKVAKEAKEYEGDKDELRQKTFVISRSSLISLNYISKKQKIPRDLLVEVSIKRLMPVIESELKKHKKRKELLKDLNEYLDHGNSLLERTGKLVGKNDFIFEMVENQVNLTRKNVLAIKNMVQKGMPMEEW